MNKHTPGPWTRGKRDATQIFAGPERLVAEVIERTRHPAVDVPREVALANARLIAAAPDLLKTLKAASDALKSYAYGNAAPALAEEIAAACDAAIAEAGGQP